MFKTSTEHETAVTKAYEACIPYTSILGGQPTFNMPEYLPADVQEWMLNGDALDTFFASQTGR